MSNVRHRRNAEPRTMNVQRAWSGRLSNACTCQAVNLKHGRAKSSKSLAVSVRAVRPLAASARPRRLVAGSGLCTEPSFGIEEKACPPEHSFLREPKKPMQALRSSAKPKTRGRAGTSCFAARAGGARLLACGVTQRTMRAGRVPQAAMPNPSIERDVQELSLLAAPHVKR